MLSILNKKKKSYASTYLEFIKVQIYLDFIQKNKI